MKLREKGKIPTCQDQKIKRGSSDENWIGIPRGCQGLKVLRTCSTARIRLRQLKKSAKKHKEQRTNTSFSITQRCRKEPEDLESNNS